MLSCKLDVLHIQTLSHPGLFGCSYGIHCMKQCFPVHNKKAMNRVKIEFDMRGLDLRGSIVPCMANCQLVESGTVATPFATKPFKFCWRVTVWKMVTYLLCTTLRV